MKPPILTSIPPPAGETVPLEGDVAGRNRAAWDRWAVDYFEPGRTAWASDAPYWGIWQLPESDLQALPPLAGREALELGCGTAYWSAWLARRGARVVGLDSSARQLASARGFQDEFGLRFPLFQASAEAVPLRDERFDLVLSEYGACLWCDPYRWLPEAARLLRPGGHLVFLTNGPLLAMCTPPDGGAATDRLERGAFELYRSDWADDGTSEYHLSDGAWIRLFSRHGLVVEELLELQAPADAAGSRWEFVTLEWARRWPSEVIWRVRKA